MTATSSPFARVGAAVAIVLVLGALAGCGSPAASSGEKTATSTPSASSSPTASATTSDTRTAMRAAAVAFSTLSTAAPDGIIMVAQTMQAYSPTATPAWQFLVGSPKSNSVFNVLVVDGQGKFQPVGSVSFSPAQWEQVPRFSAWKLDSDIAREKAIAVYPKGAKENYTVGMLAYRPVSGSDSTARPLQWRVTFDPAKRGNAATSTVLVDMATGAASLAH